MTRLPLLAFLALFAQVLFLLPSRAADPLRVAAIRPMSAAVVHPYDVCELAITLSGGTAPYANPYDPGEIAVDAVATGGQVRTLRLAVSAFWYVPYARPGGRKRGNSDKSHASTIFVFCFINIA